MGKPYSLDLRERVVAAIEAGLSTGEAAKRFCIGKATAGAWARRKRTTGTVKPERQGPPTGSKLDAHEDFILGLIEEEKDIALAEIAEHLQSEYGVRVVPATIWTFLDKRGLTFKKRRPMRASNNART